MLVNKKKIDVKNYLINFLKGLSLATDVLNAAMLHPDIPEVQKKTMTTLVANLVKTNYNNDE